MTGGGSDRRTKGVAAAAAYCGYSVKTFNKARKLGEGPDAFTAHGGRVRFATVALDRWLEQRRDVDPMAGKPGAA